MVSLAAIREAARPAGGTRPNLRVIDRKSVRAGAIRRAIYIGATSLIVAGLFAVAFVQAQLVEGSENSTASAKIWTPLRSNEPNLFETST